MNEIIENILLSPKSNFNDLRNIFTEKVDTVFFLTFNQLEGLNYFSEQCIPFIRKLHDLRNKFYLEVRPKSEHSIIYNIAETIHLFKKILK